MHRTASDVQRGRGLGLGQARVILQREHLAQPAGQVVQRSRDGGPLPHDESPGLGNWHDSRGRRALPRSCRGTAQLRLGHESQVGFRVFAVHPLSVHQSQGAANRAAASLRLAATQGVPGLRQLADEQAGSNQSRAGRLAGQGKFGGSLVPFIHSGRCRAEAAAIWSPGREEGCHSGSPRFSANRGDIVIWAILLLLGVPLWICATGILILVLRNRGLRKRAADIPMRLRIDAKGRWHRGHGLWIHDVLGFRGSPAAWNEALIWAASGTTRELTSKEAHKFRRLDQPVAATFTAADGPGFEVVTTRQHLPHLLGVFQQPGPHAESRS